MKIKQATLQQVLAYENRDVVSDFRRSLAVSEHDALDVFHETKRWLWFAANATVPVGITRNMLIIDEMWHRFIPRTQEYEAFCLRHFGRFLHHVPAREQDRAAAVQRHRADPEGFRAEKRADLKAQFAEVRRLLGEASLVKWELTYPNRWPPETCRALAIKALVTEQATGSDRVEAGALPADIRGAMPTGNALDDQLLDGALGTVYPLPKCYSCGAWCSGICVSPVRPRP